MAGVIRLQSQEQLVVVCGQQTLPRASKLC